MASQQLSAHFSLREFTRSAEAARKGIDNTPSPAIISNLVATAQMLEKIRALIQSPIRITSGYRCLRLNRAIGSKDTSDHIRGLAADIDADSFASPFHLATTLAPRVDSLAIGQLILEFDEWVHVSTKLPAKPINRILTINSSGVFPGIKGKP
jgi:zinc D-Ala-D-Ala carboxypeptidase